MPLSKKCLWYLTLVYDVLFGISGFIFICVNSLILYKISKFKELTNSDILGPIITNVVVGFLYVSMSFCGWKVAFKLHGLHLKLYAVLLIVLALFQVGCIVWTIYVQHNFIKIEISKNMEEQFTLMTEANDNAKSLWDKLQEQFNCCGIGGPTDYRKSQAVPWSCCRRITSEFSGDCTSVHQHGCLLNVYDEIYHNFTYSALSCFGMAIIFGVGVAAYFSLAKAVQRSLDNTALSNNRSLPSFQEEETQLNLLNRSQRKY